MTIQFKYAADEGCNSILRRCCVTSSILKIAEGMIAVTFVKWGIVVLSKEGREGERGRSAAAMMLQLHGKQ